MNETNVVAGGSAANAAWGEMDAACGEPFDGACEVVDPEADVIERRLGDTWLCAGIDRLHQVDFDGEWAGPGSEDVLFDVFAGQSMAAGELEAEKVDPELRKPRLVRATERNLL